MNITSVSGRLLPLLTTLCMLAPVSLWAAQEDDQALEATGSNTLNEERAYRLAIEQLENEEGAYADGLSESLLSLARNLQSRGQHEEAIGLFRRGTHLTRINEGLYCPQQIPMLQGEISSHIATQNYQQADERQNYLYRVQVRSLQGSEALADAYMQQAQWQYWAYQLELGQQGFIRLMDMWELHRLALNDTIDREGEYSPQLLPTLHGMLKTQYLISGYVIQESDQLFGEENRVSEPLLRFKAYRAKSFQRGSAVIETIAKVEKGPAGTNDATGAETLVLLGDWRLWNGRTDDAWQAYREAEMELAQKDDAQLKRRQLFGEPVALPNIAGLYPLPPVVEPDQADILLEFRVNEKGKVKDLERMDENEEQDRQASRLMRQLRRTPFRPRFEAGQPLETENFVKAFSIL
jgi:hypothetical protein